MNRENWLQEEAKQLNISVDELKEGLLWIAKVSSHEKERHPRNFFIKLSYYLDEHVAQAHELKEARTFNSYAKKPLEELLGALRWWHWYSGWIDRYLDRYVNTNPEIGRIQEIAEEVYKKEQGGEIYERFY